MIHYYVDNEISGRHYSVSSNDMWVLVQIDDGKNQVRINISPDQAEHMAQLLIYHAKLVKINNK